MFCVAMCFGKLASPVSREEGKSGIPYARFTLNVEEERTDGINTQQHPCVVWGDKLVEQILQIGVGEPITVYGSIECRSTREQGTVWTIRAKELNRLGIQPTMAPQAAEPLEEPDDLKAILEKDPFAESE